MSNNHMPIAKSTARPPSIISYPDYRAGNRYQNLLYSAYKGEVLYGDVKEALAMSRLGASTIFHINWINQIIVADALQTIDNISRFKGDVIKLKDSGGMVAWTVHNLFGHETPAHLRETERQFRKWLLENVDILIIHKSTHLEIVVSEYGAIPRRVFVHSHGLYDVKNTTLSEKNEIDALAVEPQSIICFIGQIRPYKGLNDAVDILGRISLELAKSTHVLIAGMIEDSFKDEVAEAVSSLREKIRVIFIDRRLNDAELYSATKICKAALLPYRSILNSGSLRYNQSVGAMSLMPARHTLLFADEPGVFFYDDNAHAAQLLNGILQQSRHEASAMKQSIVSQAREQLFWPDFTNVFAGLG